MRRVYQGALALSLLALTSAPGRAIEPEAPQQLISSDEAFGITIRNQLLKKTRGLSDAEISDRKALAKYYVTRNHTPMWVSDEGFNDSANSVFEAFQRAESWGLKSADYAIPQAPTPDSTKQDRLDIELAVSLAVLKYARDARGGRISKPSKELSSYLDVRPPMKPVPVVLDRLTTGSDGATFLESLHPKHDQFQRLRKKLLELRDPNASQDEDRQVLLPARGPTLGLGKTHKDIALLRDRLEVPATEAEDANVFDDALLTAVKAFQKENGLRADGLVGRGTRKALNGDYTAPPTEDVILANMEAWRWMPETLGDYYVLVNIPQYQFKIIENDQVIHQERVIVGKTNQQTPVFSDKMETIVMHPHWGVPNSIKVNEVLPRLARGHSLARQGLRIQRNGRDINPSTIDWTRADIRNYHVYQPPGRGNALGEVKFLFPNKHAVYMHDTPTKHLFKNTRRMYSHGCIRVRDPIKFAEVLLGSDKGWSADKVRAIYKKGPQNNSITLSRDIRVHVAYFTAWVNDDGSVQTWRDIYGHEKRINLALAGKHHLIRKGRDHLAPVKYDRQKLARIRQQQTPVNLFEVIFGGFN